MRVFKDVLIKYDASNNKRSMVSPIDREGIRRIATSADAIALFRPENGRHDGAGKVTEGAYTRNNVCEISCLRGAVIDGIYNYGPFCFGYWRDLKIIKIDESTFPLS